MIDPNDATKTAVILEGPEVVAGTRYYFILTAAQEELFFPEAALVKRQVDQRSPVSWLVDRPLVSPDRLARMVTQLKITTGLTDIVYSFSSTRTLFRVHQFKPVLKIIDSPVHRLLLADEVGLGKTIEAGLAWAEIDARAPTARVLVLCPGGLRRKWQNELGRRFDRDMDLVDRSGFLDFVERYHERGDAARFLGICSYSQLRHDSVLEVLSQRPPTFDLVIADEAHAMRNPETKTHQLGELLSQNTDGLLLLSATPVNLGADDLFHLLRLLLPDEFTDPALFRREIEPNAHINRALALLRSAVPPPITQVLRHLRLVEETSQRDRFLRNPMYAEVLRTLSGEGGMTAATITDLERDLTGLNSLAHVYTRTRKRELKDQPAIRRAQSPMVELTPPEQELYEAAVRLVGELRQRVQGVAPALSAIMPARQASSCLPVMRDYVQALLASGKVQADLEEGEEDDETRLEDLSDAPVELDRRSVHAIGDIRRLWDATEGCDTKFDVLVEYLAHLRAQGVEKFLIFSFFRLTLAYLHRQLAALGLRCGQMDGSTPMKRRDELIDQFREGQIDILLSSEIGSEGLDFEFCNVVINYDLPWNPMRLEQRIGRIDRFGQRSPVIHVLNFQIPGTIDTEIFFRLYNRIGIFEHSIGELEPILGETFSELSKAMAKEDLTVEEQRRLADQVALAIERESQDLARFDEAKDRLVGADTYVDHALDEAYRNRRYITPDELARYVDGFLREETSPARLDSASPGTHLHPLFGSPALAEHLRTHGRQWASPSFFDLVTRLETGGPVPATFEAEVAYQQRAEFLTIRHPLVRSTAKFYDDNVGRLHNGGYVELPSKENKGSWIFFLFLLTATGLMPRRSLFGVAWNRRTGVVSTELGQEIQTFLAGPDPARKAERDIPMLEPEECIAAYQAVLAAVDQARGELSQELQRRNDAMISARQESLSQGCSVRKHRLDELAERPGINERIRRMRLGQIRNLEERTRTAIRELENRRSVTVGFKPVAGGLAVTR